MNFPVRSNPIFASYPLTYYKMFTEAIKLYMYILLEQLNTLLLSDKVMAL